MFIASTKTAITIMLTISIASRVVIEQQIPVNVSIGRRIAIIRWLVPVSTRVKIVIRTVSTIRFVASLVEEIHHFHYVCVFLQVAVWMFNL